MTDLCLPDCSWPGNCPCYDHVTPEPSPTRCDCRFHDDGTTTVCGIHEPPPLMYYEPEDNE